MWPWKSSLNLSLPQSPHLYSGNNNTVCLCWLTEMNQAVHSSWCVASTESIVLGYYYSRWATQNWRLYLGKGHYFQTLSLAQHQTTIPGHLLPLLAHSKLVVFSSYYYASGLLPCPLLHFPASYQCFSFIFPFAFSFHPGVSPWKLLIGKPFPCLFTAWLVLPTLGLFLLFLCVLKPTDQVTGLIFSSLPGFGFFWSDCKACGILVPQPRVEAPSPALGTWSLNQ